MHKNLYTLNLRSPGQLRPLIDQISSKPHCNEKQLENRGEFHFRCFLNWSRQLGPILCLFVQTGSQCSKAAPAARPNCTSEPVCLWGWGWGHFWGMNAEISLFCFVVFIYWSFASMPFFTWGFALDKPQLSMCSGHAVLSWLGQVHQNPPNDSETGQPLSQHHLCTAGMTQMSLNTGRVLFCFLKKIIEPILGMLAHTHNFNHRDCSAW